MSEKQFVCIDVGYGDDWYITDNGKRLSDMEIVDLLNEQQATITKLKELNDDKGKRIISLIRTNKTLKEENEQLKKARDESDKFIVKKGLEIEFLEWCIK